MVAEVELDSGAVSEIAQGGEWGDEEIQKALWMKIKCELSAENTCLKKSLGI